MILILNIAKSIAKDRGLRIKSLMIDQRVDGKGTFIHYRAFLTLCDNANSDSSRRFFVIDEDGTFGERGLEE